MKKLVLIFCLVMLPLTLASDTQHRFKVYVDVSGDDKQVVNTIESHLKRELRLLGDVDIVGKDDDWEYIIGIFVLEIKWKDGTTTGSFAIAIYDAIRLPKYMYKDPKDYESWKAILNVEPSVAYYPKERLHEYCINKAGAFNNGISRFGLGIFHFFRFHRSYFR